MILKLFYKKVKIGVVLWSSVRIIRPRCHGVRPQTAPQQSDFSKVFNRFEKDNLKINFKSLLTRGLNAVECIASVEQVKRLSQQAL
ncbi:hypothetical protein [Oceanospirillum beijerinckii]|uniref:hypothetical protein n=1 Tax=Oceanospirillum beijerinckii TaxID=64976 RepID=UPI00047FCAD9|nr:hypothetical protein [Oceanospirillum beijerinckii]